MNLHIGEVRETYGFWQEVPAPLPVPEGKDSSQHNNNRRCCACAGCCSSASLVEENPEDSMVLQERQIESGLQRLGSNGGLRELSPPDEDEASVYAQEAGAADESVVTVSGVGGEWTT